MTNDDKYSAVTALGMQPLRTRFKLSDGAAAVEANDKLCDDGETRCLFRSLLDSFGGNSIDNGGSI